MNYGISAAEKRGILNTLSPHLFVKFSAVIVMEKVRSLVQNATAAEKLMKPCLEILKACAPVVMGQEEKTDIILVTIHLVLIAMAAGNDLNPDPLLCKSLVRSAMGKPR